MKIIFFHIPKVAGESLRQIMPDGTFFIGHNFYHPEYHHLYFDIEDHIKRFVISFVRNPYDRVVSAFHYLNSGGINDTDLNDKKLYIEKYNGNFEDFVKNSFPNILHQIHFMPQYDWIYYRGVSLCNFIGKYESIQEDIIELSKIIKLKSTDLPELNTSNHKSYLEYYTGELRDIVYYNYEKDFKIFGYER